MSEPPDDNRPRSQRGDGATYASRSTPPKAQGRQPSGTQERPYKLYRSSPRSLTARLRGETDTELEARADQLSRQKPPRPPRGAEPPRRRFRIPGRRVRVGPRRPRLHPISLLKYFVLAIIAWLA